MKTLKKLAHLIRKSNWSLSSGPVHGSTNTDNGFVLLPPQYQGEDWTKDPSLPRVSGHDLADVVKRSYEWDTKPLSIIEVAQARSDMTLALARVAGQVDCDKYKQEVSNVIAYIESLGDADATADANDCLVAEDLGDAPIWKEAEKINADVNAHPDDNEKRATALVNLAKLLSRVKSDKVSIILNGIIDHMEYHIMEENR